MWIKKIKPSQNNLANMDPAGGQRQKNGLVGHEARLKVFFTELHQLNEKMDQLSCLKITTDIVIVLLTML